MKLLFENWRKHLNEELLTEFDRNDKESLMAIQDRFTISYEIELESNSPMDISTGSPESRSVYARGYLSEDFFHDRWAERESGDFWQHYTGDDEPDPRELTVKYLTEEYPTRVDPNSEDSENLVRFEIAIKENEEIAKEFSMLYKNTLLPGKRENKALVTAINDDPEIKEALKKRGIQFKTAQQGTLPFDDEAKEEMILLGLDAAALKEIVHTYLFNPESDQFFPSAGSDRTISLLNFLHAAGWDEEGDQWIEEADELIENLIIKGGVNRYPTVGDITYFSSHDWSSVHLKEMAMMIAIASSEWFDENVKSDWNEYQDDPEGYLDDFGYDWEEGYQPTGDGGGIEELLEKHLPRFMGKWADQLKFEEDGSLRNGVEFSMDSPKFMTSLNTAFEFLKDFFFDYNRQANFYFDSNTGLHTNIGYLDKDENLQRDYNLMKALLFLNHDFALKEFGQRKGSRWALDLKSDIVDRIEREFKRNRSDFRDLATTLYKENKLDALGVSLSDFIATYAPSNAKSLGFNLHYIDRLGYVEFRYPGGRDPDLENMKKATLYYAYVIKQAVDPNYKKKEYEQKLVKLMTSLVTHVDRPTSINKVKDILKKDAIYLLPDFGGDRALQNYISRVLGTSIPGALYTKVGAMFKGIRKGKTLKDTEAVFKVVAHKFHDSPNTEAHEKFFAALKDPDAYSIEERLIPIPELERMIVNKTFKTLGDHYADVPAFINPLFNQRAEREAEEVIEDVFAALYRGPGPIKENKIKIRLVKK